MAFEHYIYTGTTRLRCGYTTGSCAALAAKAACEMLLSRKPVGRVSIVTPGGLPVEVDVVDACIGEGCAQCAVRKDAGDDADVTDGVLVYARVARARALRAARACPRANRKFPSMAAWAWGA